MCSCSVARSRVQIKLSNCKTIVHKPRFATPPAPKFVMTGSSHQVA